MPSFVHLHVYSDYSLLRGLCAVDRLAERAKALGMTAVALTDQGNMFGALEFYKECQAVGIKPIVGCQVYLAPTSRFEKTNESKYTDQPFPLVLIAQNDTGYKNLIKLVSVGYTEGFFVKPRIDFSLLEKYSEGLIALSGPTTGEIPTLLLKGSEAEARERAKAYAAVFGKNYYFELTDHGLPEERELNQKLVALGRELGIPLVATAQTHYLAPEDSYAHEIFLCIDSKASIYWEKGKGRDQREALPGTDYHLLSEAEMQERFAEYPEALANTVRIADSCDVHLGKSTPHMPEFEIPSGETPTAWLKKQSIIGLEARLGKLNQEYLDRLDFEIGVIGKMGFPSYFLIVADFVNEAKRSGILVGPGRGSAAGSLVSYGLGITNLDPIRQGLLFERFLNPERVNLPDVDIDFQDNRREEVIEYIRKRYGREKISQIVTYSKLKPKAVFKDVARVFEVEFNTANKLSALIGGAKSLDEAYATKPEFKEAILSQPKFQEVFQHSKKLEGLTRQVGIHAAGVIIADKAVDEYVPLYADMAENLVCTQYEGEVLEEACGLIKMDLLGLSTLTIIDEALKLIKKHHGETVDIDRIPLDDPKTYALFAAGKTEGIFQFESDGMKKYLVDLVPNTLDDLIAMNAMYRPGPLSWIGVYVARKHGRKPEFKQPEDEENYKKLEELTARKEVLRTVLGPTNLIPIYQEQIMELGRSYAGFSLGEADLMRRAMGKKKVEVLKQTKHDFVEKAETLGHARADSEFLFDKIIFPFSGYGFNKSHAACYALVAYQTAWLKANYPACFMTALLNAEIADTDKIKQYMDECRSLALTVHSPDINESDLMFRVRDGGIQYALAAIKGVGLAAGGGILEERKKNNTFISFADFFRRMAENRLNKQVTEQLVKAGAFEPLGLDAGQIFHILPELEKRVLREVEQRLGGQMTIFDSSHGDSLAAGEEDGGDNADLLKRGSEFESDKGKLKDFEKEGLGFNLRLDPLMRFSREFLALSNLSATAKIRPGEKKEVVFAGVVAAIKKIVTKKNDEMAFLTLENPSGRLDGVLFPRTFKTALGLKTAAGAELLVSGAAVIVTGKAETRDRGTSLLVDKIEEFLPEKAPKAVPAFLHIQFDGRLSGDELAGLKSSLHESYGGKCSVFLHFDSPEGRRVTVRAGERLTVFPDKVLEANLSRLAFVKKYWLA